MAVCIGAPMATETPSLPARAPRIVRRARRNPERFTPGNAVKLLDDGSESLPAMIEAIRSARRQIDLEMYWFASDDTGRRFAEALCERAGAGVEVNVLYDAVGCLETDQGMFDEMCAHGVRVVQFHPIAPWRKRFKWDWVFWNRRDHRKLLVVDGRLAYTGGLNLTDASAPVSEGGAGWRDAMVEIRGPTAHRLGHVFGATWRRCGGPPLVDPQLPPKEPPDAPDAVEGARIVLSGRGGKRRQIRRHYLYRIYAARRTIHIANAYFVPDRIVVRALRRAASRGVDVRILLPFETDIPLVRFAARALYTKLIEGGVHVHEYHGAVLHAKTAVVDGVWSTVGSYNLDFRSWKLNLELNAVVRDERFGRRMEERFQEDLRSANEVRLRDFRLRPLSDRLFERLAHLVRFWL